MGFRKTAFGLLWDPLGKILRETVLEISGDHESRLLFKDHLLQAQDRLRLL